jgi:ankyrin repeat protein
MHLLLVHFWVRTFLYPSHTLRCCMALHCSCPPHAAPLFFSDLEQNTTGIHFAAGSGDANGLYEFLQPETVEQHDLNGADAYGRTPLVYTVLADAIDCAQLLLQAGALIEFPDSDGRTSLHWAAFQGTHKMLKFLLKYDGNAVTQDNEGRTPLHLSTGAESSKGTKLLLKAMPEEGVNIVDKDSMTAAHWCAFHGNHKHLELLVSAGANLTVADAEGKLPVHWTSANTTAKTLTMIIEAAPETLNVADGEGRTVLHLSVADGSTSNVQTLLEIPGIEISTPDQMQRTPLHWAAVLGNAELSTLLLQAGADPNALDDNGASALHYTTQNESIACLEALLGFDGVTDSADADGRTAVMWAAGSGGAEAVQMMTERGMDVLAVDNSGGTALHAAAYAGHNDIILTLLQNSASIDALDSMQHTGLVRACEMGHAAVVVTLLAGGATSDLRDVDGRTPLHWAALGGFDYICRALIENGASVDTADEQGRTALQCAAYGAFIDVMTVLCDAKADVNTVDAEGISALHWASSTGQLEAVKLLTKHGATPNQMEADGEQLTPLDYARIGDGEGHEHGAIVDFLVNQGGLSAELIKSISATKMQNAWRNYKKKKDAAHGQAGVIKGGKRGGRASYAVGHTKAMGSDFKTSISHESALEKKARVNKITTSAVEREATKRKKRIKERQHREESQKEEDTRRKLEDEKRRLASSSVLLRSARLHTETIKERDRMTLFRQKQRAATTIQVFWRKWIQQGRSKGSGKRSRTDRTYPTKEEMRRDAPQLTRIGKELDATVKGIDQGMKGLQVRRRELGIVETFKKTNEWREAVAALTIQLFWRQYKRRKLVAAAARRKDAYLDEWRIKQHIKKEFSEKSGQQRSKFAAVYNKQVLAHPYHAPGPITMYRPRDVIATPSAAVQSFNFAVGSYVGNYATNRSPRRRGSAEVGGRSPTRSTRGGSRSPKKKPVFAF